MDVRTRTFPSTPDAAAGASDFVLAVAEDLGFSEEICDALLLVAGEAVANAAGHGNRLDPARRVVVGCGASAEEAVFWVEDEGPGISQERLDRAALPEDVLQTNGRGLFIIKSLADRVWLEEDGRRICVAWRRDRAGEAGS